MPWVVTSGCEDSVGRVVSVINSVVVWQSLKVSELLLITVSYCFVSNS